MLCVVGFGTFFCCGICQGVNLQEVDESGDRQPGEIDTLYLQCSYLLTSGQFSGILLINLIFSST